MDKAPIGIIIVSHNKPKYVEEAIFSVWNQSFTDWQAIVYDSGVLWDQGFFEDKFSDKRMLLCGSGETVEDRTKYNMASLSFNTVLPAIINEWDLIMYLCDDDILYKDAFKEFVELRREMKYNLMYSSQHIGRVVDGQTRIVGTRIADKIRGPGELDCKVDYLQFCHSAQVIHEYMALNEIGAIDVGKPWPIHSTNKADSWHADGLFMESLAKIYPVHPIDKVLSLNRRTPESVNIK